MRRAAPAALVPLALAAGLSAAAEPGVPAQADRDAARRAVTTGDGLRLTHVEPGEGEGKGSGEGKGEGKGEGTPLILLHGYTDNGRSRSLPALEHPIDPDSPFMPDWYWNPPPVDEEFLVRERAASASRPQQVWTGVPTAPTLTDWTALAPPIAAPTLIPWGDQDGLFGAAGQEALRAALPAARFEGCEGRSHDMFWEVPEAAGRLIAGFLDG